MNVLFYCSIIYLIVDTYLISQYSIICSIYKSFRSISYENITVNYDSNDFFLYLVSDTLFLTKL